MAAGQASNKTKIAKRVIEVFEYFDNKAGPATVMDIVRHYGRPQSSTSELLASLVEMGLLYKNPRLRTYAPTPRLAALGSHTQPDTVRNGRLFAFMDHLCQSSRHSVALFGLTGTHVQIFRLAAGVIPLGAKMVSGASVRLSDSAAGHLLLSTLPNDTAGRLLRRLNAEATGDEHFSYTAIYERLQQIREQRHATGLAGFSASARVTAVLLPRAADEPPLAIGIVYPNDSSVDGAALVSTLRRGLSPTADDQHATMTATPTLLHAV